MTEDRAGVQRRRARRPTEVAARLERLRKRNAAQLEAQREAERRVEVALTSYVDAEVSISGVEQVRDSKVADLERQIEQVRAAAVKDIEQIRARQALAVWQINDAGRTVEQIAELLEIPQKDIRRLLSAGRAAAEHQPTEQAADGTPSHGSSSSSQSLPSTQCCRPDALETVSEQRILSGVDAHQHGPNPGFVPAVTHGSSEGV
jgi:hypothetical protein